MDLKTAVKKLVSVDINTNDFKELLKDPEKYTKSKEDLEKVKEILTLIELSKKASR